MLHNGRSTDSEAQLQPREMMSVSRLSAAYRQCCNDLLLSVCWGVLLEQHFVLLKVRLQREHSVFQNEIVEYLEYLEKQPKVYLV